MLRNGLAAGCSQPSPYTDRSALNSPQLWLDSNAWEVPFDDKGTGLGLGSFGRSMQQYGYNENDFHYYGYEVSCQRRLHLTFSSTHTVLRSMPNRSLQPQADV